MALVVLGACTPPLQARPGAGTVTIPVPNADEIDFSTPASASPSVLPAPFADSVDVSRLRKAVAAYQKIFSSGGWPAIPAGSSLKAGMSSSRIVALRARLAASGDLAQAATSEAFDDTLTAAVRHFQKRHGLQEDGVVGGKSLSAMNVTVTDRLTMLNINLQRLLREQRRWGARYVAVNIPAATYRLVEDGAVVFERAAIVGRPNWQTPVMSGLINELVFHPTWTVPPRIARLELLPRIRRDSSYLAAHHMRFANGMIQQAPGPANPLGVVKFVFPNDDSIYLHDTNARDLFNRAERFLSHGCIRVSDALDLARHLLQGQPEWSEMHLSERVRKVETERVHLANPIPVHIVYDTAWVDSDDTINFRDDIYHRD